MNLIIDDVISKLLKMKKDGYCCFKISEICVDECSQFGLRNSLCFYSLNSSAVCSGFYGSVDEVSLDEVCVYSN